MPINGCNISQKNLKTLQMYLIMLSESLKVGIIVNTKFLIKLSVFTVVASYQSRSVFTAVASYQSRSGGNICSLVRAMASGPAYSNWLQHHPRKPRGRSRGGQETVASRNHGGGGGGGEKRRRGEKSFSPLLLFFPAPPPPPSFPLAPRSAPGSPRMVQHLQYLLVDHPGSNVFSSGVFAPPLPPLVSMLW